MEGKANLTVLFFSWWYKGAVDNLLKYIKAAYIYSADLFSVRICLRTLFDPWKRDALSYEGLNIQQKFNTWTLNLASRLVGLMIKLLTLLGYLLFTVLLTIISVAILLIWIFYPLIIFYLIYKVLG